MKSADKKMPRQALVFYPVDDFGDVAQVDGRAVGAALDDEVAITLGGVDLAVRPEGNRLVATIKLPGAGIGRPGADGGAPVLRKSCCEW